MYGAPPSISLLPPLPLSLFDSMEERYGKLKKFSEKFIICQLGMAAIAAI